MKIRAGVFRNYFLEFEENDKYAGTQLIIETRYSNSNTNNVYNEDYDVKSLHIDKNS